MLDYERLGKWTNATAMICYDKNNNIVHHYIYCKRKEDGVVGIYDLVKQNSKIIRRT